MLHINIGKKELQSLLLRQLAFFHSEKERLEEKIFENVFSKALDRCFYCFSRIRNKYYHDGNKVQMSPSHTGQYSIFLYFLSHSAYKDFGYVSLAEKAYALNKMLHSVDLFYEVELPDVFFLDHPLGSVIGRGWFSNYFAFSQNCTVGNNKGRYPRFGQQVELMAGVTVVGDCTIGDHCILSAGVYLKDVDIPSGSVVFGRWPDLTIKDRKSVDMESHGRFIIQSAPSHENL